MSSNPWPAVLTTWMSALPSTNDLNAMSPRAPVAAGGGEAVGVGVGVGVVADPGLDCVDHAVDAVVDGGSFLGR